MNKTSCIGPLAAALLLAASAQGWAAPASPAAGHLALDAFENQKSPPPAWDATVPGAPDAADSASRSGLDLGGLDSPGAPALDALPLSQVAGADSHAATPAAHPSLWDFVARVRDGGLPEPASWALILIGFGMIGAALRGLVIANRRLARLQPEDAETPAAPHVEGPGPA